MKKISPGYLNKTDSLLAKKPCVNCHWCIDINNMVNVVHSSYRFSTAMSQNVTEL